VKHFVTLFKKKWLLLLLLLLLVAARGRGGDGQVVRPITCQVYFSKVPALFQSVSKDDFPDGSE